MTTASSKVEISATYRELCEITAVVRYDRTGEHHPVAARWRHRWEQVIHAARNFVRRLAAAR